MIKFFRKIRQNLIMENKTGKYLKYAIGEIILVVIGILIALQINNWNQNRRNNLVVMNYYGQILKDLNKDKAQIQVRIKELTENIQLYETYNSEFEEQESVSTLIASQAKLNFLFRQLSFNTNTIRSLESTGDIKLIPVKLRNRLIDLKNNQERTIKVTSGNAEIFLTDLMSAVNLGFSPQIFQAQITGNSQLLTQLKVEENFAKAALIVNGAYSIKYFTEQNLLETLIEMLEDIDTLSELIVPEISK